MDGSPKPDERVLVVGGGPGGLAVTHCLEKAGIAVRTVERHEEPAATWRGHYDSLLLFSSRRVSALPGRRMPRIDGRFPGRDTIVDYLVAYEKSLTTKVEHGVEVLRIERHYGGWLVETSKDVSWHPAVVIATGLQRDPKQPTWPGEDRFHGEVLHARDFRNGRAYRGKDVLVVGAGITGTDLAQDLVRNGAKQVRVAVRTPPLLLPVTVFGVSFQAFTQALKFSPLPEAFLETVTRPLIHKVFHRRYEKRFGIPAPTYGGWETFAGNSGTVNFDRGGMKMIERGDFTLVPALDRFEDGEAILVDGTRAKPDVVIVATGQRPGLEPMVGHLGVLNRLGRPVAHGAETPPTAPRMFFVGFRVPPAQLGDIRLDARAIAKRLEREFSTGATWRQAPRPMSNPVEPFYPPETVLTEEGAVRVPQTVEAPPDGDASAKAGGKLAGATP